MKRWLTILTALAVLGGASFAFADEKKDDEWMKGKLFPPELIMANQAKLKLTDAQKQVIKSELVLNVFHPVAADYASDELGICV